MEQGQDSLLQPLIHIDEQVAAAHQVEVTEGGVAGHVVKREDHHVPQLAGDSEVVPSPGEKAIQPRLRKVGGDAVGVGSRPPGLKARLIDVGGENLDRHLPLLPFHDLGQKDGQGIGLLSRGAPGHPDTDRVVGRAPAQQLLELLLERREGLRVPEETRDVDQQVVEQGMDLRGFFAEIGEVVGHPFELVQGHPPLDAPADGAFLVAGKIMPRHPLDDPQDFIQFRLQPLFAQGSSHLAPGLAALALVAEQFPAHLLGRQDEIDQPRLDGRPGHAGVFRLVFLLGHDQATGGVDRSQPLGTVGPRPGEDDGNCIFSLVVRQGEEEVVDELQGQGPRTAGKKEPPVPDGESLVGRADVNPVRLGGHALFDFHHRQRGVAFQQGGHDAFAVGGLMLEDDESHAGGVGQMGQERFDGAQPPCGGADGHDGKITLPRLHLVLRRTRPFHLRALRLFSLEALLLFP